MNIPDWKDIYASKLVTAKEAISYIKSGDRVVTGHAAAEPTYLIDTLVDNYEMYENVEICHLVSLCEGKYTRPEMKGHFIFNGFFVSACTREAVNNGSANFTPGFFHEVPKLFRTEMPVDVALVTASNDIRLTELSSASFPPVTLNFLLTVLNPFEYTVIV